jgi:6-phosphogluconate dehydrogenase
MCPGGDESALKEVLPLLQKVAAKDREGKPCVGVIGKGGAGHYVKMVHNGIEHGMMSAICEAWGIMRKLGMGYEEIGEVFKDWNSSGELVSSVQIQLTSTSDASYSKVHSWSRLALISLTNASRVMIPTPTHSNTRWSSLKFSTRSYRT